MQFYVFIGLFLVYYQATARIWAWLDVAPARIAVARWQELVVWLLPIKFGLITKPLHRVNPEEECAAAPED